MSKFQPYNLNIRRDRLFPVLHNFLLSQLRESRDTEVVNMTLPSSQDELPVRTMQDSFCWSRIPLGSDTRLREKYVNFHNHVRFGRLMEDLDTMSGKFLV